jgi:hypothetical protein
LQKLSKTMDHLEHAKREGERLLIEEAHLKWLQDDEKFYKEQQEVYSSCFSSLDDMGNSLHVFFWAGRRVGWHYICLVCVLQEAIEQSQKQDETDLVEKKRLICMLEDKVLSICSICSVDLNK